MYDNLNLIDEYVGSLRRNSEFLRRMLSPKVSIPIVMVCLSIVGMVAIF